MQTIRLIVLGKLKEKYLTEACAEYAKRMSAFCRLEVIELEPARLPENPSEGMIEKALAEEGARILQKAQNSKVISLCIEGTQLSSEQLSRTLSELAQNGESTVSFVIGSSHGLHESVKASSALRLSMSKMTFPHQLARVMLSEQIYRAYQIQHNGKYHK